MTPTPQPALRFGLPLQGAQRPRGTLWAPQPAGGVDTGGPPSFGKADRQAFASQLDQWLLRTAAT